MDARHVSTWNSADTRQAEWIRKQYQRQHDHSDRWGQTAGIDLASGQVWIGNSIAEVVAQSRASGSEALLFYLRIGARSYYRIVLKLSTDSPAPAAAG